MKPTIFSGIFLALLPLIAAAGPLEDELEGALRRGEVPLAQAMLRQMTFAQARPVLERQAARGNTLAMWGMAESWKSQKNLQQAANYTYQAWFGTMLDGSSCLHSDAKQAGPERILQAHAGLMAWVRTDENVRRIALYRTGLFYRTNPAPVIPQWVCRTGGSPKLLVDPRGSRLVAMDELMKVIQFKALETYYTRSNTMTYRKSAASPPPK